MIRIKLEKQNAITLLASLQQRLEVIQQIEARHPEGLSPTLKEERSALAPAIVAIEQALKRPPDP
ncbi:hypothetical protein [Methylosinus sp. Ce-a6]|uniref:hypothetical protein n=1 Tax=Methylosinus sp. Ce-a6 TaxID=2172005 RepID=UPI0013594F98|nr:hypothetical protein [Methylosinus sp. Ce-a6]